MSNSINSADVAKYKGVLLELVPKNGNTIGNGRVRPQLIERIKKDFGVTITEDDYWSIRDALVADGLIKVGRGNGGSIYLVNVVTQPLATSSTKYKVNQISTIQFKRQL
jgi:hypothetical protein